MNRRGPGAPSRGVVVIADSFNVSRWARMMSGCRREAVRKERETGRAGERDGPAGRPVLPRRAQSKLMCTGRDHVARTIVGRSSSGYLPCLAARGSYLGRVLIIVKMIYVFYNVHVSVDESSE